MKKGSKMSEESKRKMSETRKRIGCGKWMLGRKASEETKRKMSEAQKRIGNRPPSSIGKKHTEETKRKMSESNPRYFLGKKLSEEHKRKLSEFHKANPNRSQIKKGQTGKLCPAWKGGLSLLPYPSEWTKTLKLAIRQRDNFTCQKCGITEEEHIQKFGRVLSVNHIDYDKTNCDPKNLNTLCHICNCNVNANREYWTNFFKQKLCV